MFVQRREKSDILIKNIYSYRGKLEAMSWSLGAQGTDLGPRAEGFCSVFFLQLKVYTKHSGIHIDSINFKIFSFFSKIQILGN